VDDRPAPDAAPPPPEPPPPEPPLPAPQPPARQRWRLIVARDPGAPALAQRELSDAWQSAMEAAGLPVARTEGATARPRISFGAPLQVGMAAEGELIDVVLTERWPAWRLREALEPVLPMGWRLVRTEDVWLGGPPLAGRVAAADYRITLAVTSEVVGADLERACASLVNATQLPRQRAKGDRLVAYDLRSLLVDVRVQDDGPPIVIVARTRFHPELGTGRPEEVVAALADELGVVLAIDEVVRERVLVVEDLDPGDAPQAAATAARVGRK
jgi:radical SAM-linked protein